MTPNQDQIMALLGKASAAKTKGSTQKTARIVPPPLNANPVKSYAQIASLGERKKAIRIVMDIEEGWYIYGKPLVFPYMSPLSVDIRGSHVQEVLEITFPPPSSARTIAHGKPAMNLYRGKITIEAKLLIKKTAAGAKHASEGNDLRVSLRYQPCSQSRCLAPVSTAYRVSL